MVSVFISQNDFWCKKTGFEVGRQVVLSKSRDCRCFVYAFVSNMLLVHSYILTFFRFKGVKLCLKIIGIRLHVSSATMFVQELESF